MSQQRVSQRQTVHFANGLVNIRVTDKTVLQAKAFFKWLRSARKLPERQR